MHVNPGDLPLHCPACEARLVASVSLAIGPSVEDAEYGETTITLRTTDEADQTGSVQVTKKERLGDGS